jgi:hypothetical protein
LSRGFHINIFPFFVKSGFNLEKNMKRYNVTQAIEIQGRDKPMWHKHGVAFENPGKPVRIKLESLPMPNKDGEVWLTLFEDTKSAENGSQSLPGNDFGSATASDEDIPF